MRFDYIVADPPWALSDSLSMDKTKRGASDHYPLLTTSELCKLDVKSLAAEDGCALALWIVGSMLDDGVEVMKAWGFKQKQIYVWVKTKKKKNKIMDVSECLAFGMGRTFRQTHELCLIGINNTKVYKKLQNKSQRSVCFDEVKKHSAKPEHLQNSLELMFGKESAKLEIFARRQRDGWLSIGNEVCAGQDIRDTVPELIKL
jgi:N6-adenosine-specific RNA methylase IME4